MMNNIKFITGGDIFKSNCEVLVNPVNCVGVSGAGLALQFKLKYPHQTDKYREVCLQGNLKPGEVLYEITQTRPIILYAATKNHWRHKSKHMDILKCLDGIVNIIRQEGWNSIAIPALGCGLGGLRWGTIKPDFIEILSRLDKKVKVKVYEPH